MPDQPAAPTVEQWARALAGAAHINPKRDTAPWDSLGEADRDGYREQARRIVSQTGPDGARTTPDNPAGSGDAADNSAEGNAGERYAAAIRPTMLIGLQDAELFDEPGRERINEWVDWIAKQVATVRDSRVEQLTAGRATWKAKAEEIEQDRDRLAATIVRVQRLLDTGPIGTCCDYLLRAALNPQEQP